MNETATQLHTTDNSNATNNNNNINNNNNAKMDRSVSPTPSEQQYSLKWNDFQSSILSSFRHLRDEEDFVDVTLACEQRSFRAHKVVLSACSPYFRKLLKANPCEHPIVILRDVRSEDVESLLRFMYNGEVNIGQDQLSDFLKTSQLLQVRGLADVTNPSRTSNSTLNSSLSTPAVQELKASPTSTSLPWELPEDTTQPPPQKRTKSSDLYRKQHGLSPEAIALRDSLPGQQHSLTRERDRSRDSRDMRDRDRERDRSLELRESLLGQALEGGPTLIVPPPKHPDLPASAGEDSNSSDTAASDHGDYDGTMDGMNGSMEPTRPSFPSAFLGLPGLPGLLPGPSGMHGDNFELSKSHQTMGNFFGSISRHNTHETLQHLSMDKDARQHCEYLIKEEIEEDDEEDEEMLKDEILSSTSAETDYQKNVMDPGDYFVAHKSGSGELSIKHHFLSEQSQQQHQQHLQRQHLAGFLLTPTSTSHNNQTNTSSGNGSVGGGASNNCSNVNNNLTDLKIKQERNMFIGNNNSGQVYLLPCPLCEVPLEPRVFRQHLDRHYPRDSPVCPVIQCGRRFAHPNSVRNHMRLKHTTQWAKMKAMRSSGGPFTGIP